MNKREKLLTRFLKKPKDFTFNELKVLFAQFDYYEIKKGKTSGSRRAFHNAETGHIIRIHKPHQKEILKGYQIDFIIKELKRKEVL